MRRRWGLSVVVFCIVFMMLFLSPFLPLEIDSITTIPADNSTIPLQRSFHGNMKPSGESLEEIDLFNPIQSSTIYGGSSWERIADMVLLSDGRIVIVGSTNSRNLPLQNPIQYEHAGGDTDCFIAIFNSDGNDLLYSTYIGGEEEDIAVSVAIDLTGIIIITGITKSWYFPSLGGPGNSVLVGEDWDREGWDCFVLGIDSTTGLLVFSFKFGGNRSDWAESVDIDEEGSVYVAGWTESPIFPIKDGYDMTYGGVSDGFIIKFDSTLTGVEYSTFLGGSNIDCIVSMSVRNSRATVTGYTFSDDFPCVVQEGEPPEGELNGLSDCFVCQLHENGQELFYSDYLGGELADSGLDVFVDQEMNIFLTGRTESPDFPRTTSGLNHVDAKSTKFFVIRKDANPPEFHYELVYSEFFGGSGKEEGKSFFVDSSDNICVGGSTNSLDFPLTCPFDSTCESSDGFLFVLDYIVNEIRLSSYIGGTMSDDICCVRPSNSGTILAAGHTKSVDFPATTFFNMSTVESGDVFIINLEDMSDLDNDRMTDSWERYYGLNDDFDDSSFDSDDDNLTNLEEYRIGTSPIAVDSDLDSMTDDWEFLNLLDPLRNDAAEDPDDDTLANLDEYLYGTSPHSSDSDSDTIPDAWEVFYGLNPLEDDSMNDLDGDDLTNLQEYIHGTNPGSSDSDGDLMPDSWEVERGTNPLVDDSAQDYDDDGLTNLEEYRNNTDPNSADGDSDGFSDTWELANGFDPNDANVPVMEMFIHSPIPITAVSILALLVPSFTYSHRKLKKRKEKIIQQELTNREQEIQELLDGLLEDT
ncbi:MAG: hypothetical protein ACFFF9_06870 [Candidatus Thorarchaeota archaeon]